MKRILGLLLLVLASNIAYAQKTWYDPQQAEYDVMQNQAFVDQIKGYSRLPESAKGVVRDAVWNLSRHSAGVAIFFRTDSPDIEIKYTTISRSYAMPHMPSTGVSGVDLYRVDNRGEWCYLAGGYSFGDQVTYKYNDLPKASADQEFEYRLYLPLYNGVKSLQIGVNEGCEFEFVPTSTKKPIVLYGTSIAQGGCCSRPAMAWGTVVHRELDYPLVNLGFSGNGHMEPEVLDYIAQIDAALYILDCLPNVANRTLDDLYQLLISAVKQIRQKSQAPILLVDHVGFSDEKTDRVNREKVKTANAANLKAYEALRKQGDKRVYYLSQKELGLEMNSTVDGIHLTDWGMVQQGEAVADKVRKILHLRNR